MAQRRRADVRQDHDGSLPIRAWLEFSGDVDPPVDSLIDWMLAVASDVRDVSRGIAVATMGHGGLPTALSLLMTPIPITSVDPDDYVPASAFQCSYSAWSHLPPEVPDLRVEIRIEGPWRRLVAELLGSSWLVERYLEACRTTRAVTGFIGRLASYAMTTPAEDAADLPFRLREQLCTHVRGAFWGTLVTHQHVDALGGVDCLRDAPVHEVRAVERAGGGSAYFLQLNDEFVSEPADQVAALTSFLAPILPA